MDIENGMLNDHFRLQEQEHERQMEEFSIRELNKDTVVCKSCGTVNDYRMEKRTFKNGSKHVGAYCNTCEKYIKWLPQHVKI